MNGRAIVALGLVVATALPAQSRSKERDASTRLYAARLHEVLDLDVRGAIAQYQAVAVERTGNERWIAVARLEELRRLGLAASQPVPMTEWQKDVKAMIGKLAPLPVADLLEAAKLPKVPLREGPGEGAPLLDPHAASREVESWVRASSGPSVSERARMRAAGTRPTPAPIDETRALAADVLRRELAGRTELAARYRDLYFSTWRPPVVNGTPTDLLVRARSNLEAWIKEVKENPFQVELLTRLKDELDQRGATNAGQAVQLLQRLPHYAERLLAEPKVDSGK